MNLRAYYQGASGISKKRTGISTIFPVLFVEILKKTKTKLADIYIAAKILYPINAIIAEKVAISQIL
tara:strand:+ start:3857 stop:4057 length:201 start_codon:yes stop_codon:yes gene_type:complete